MSSSEETSSTASSSSSPAPPDLFRGQESSSISESDLRILHQKYFVSPNYTFSVPGPSVRASDSSEREFILYEDSFKAGLRLPVHPNIGTLLRYYNLSPTQMSPNSWRMVIAFLSRCHQVGVPFSIPIFRSIFCLKQHVGKYWWYFSARPGQIIISGQPSANHGWKDRFFLVRHKELKSPFLPGWSQPFLKGNKLPLLSPSEEEALQKLKTNVPKLRDLLSEVQLSKARLSPATEETMNINFSLLNKELKKRKRAEKAKKKEDQSHGAQIGSGPAQLPSPPKSSPKARSKKKTRADPPPADAVVLIDEAEVAPSELPPIAAAPITMYLPAPTDAVEVLAEELIAEEYPPAQAVLPEEVPPADLGDKTAEAPSDVPPAQEIPPAPRTEPSSSSQESGFYKPKWTVRSTDSALFSPTAERLIQGICLPQDRQFFRSKSVEELFSSQCRSLAESAHGLVALAEQARARESTVNELSNQINLLQGELDQKSREYAIQYVQLNDYSRKFGELKEENILLSNKMDSKENELKELRLYVDKERKKFADEKAFLSAKVSEANINSQNLKTALADLENSVADLRSAWDEDKKKAEDEMESLRSIHSKELEKARRAAVEEYKSSAECELEKNAYAAASYDAGFEICKQKISEVYPSCDLTKIQLVSEDEDSDEDSWPSGRNQD